MPVAAISEKTLPTLRGKLATWHAALVQIHGPASADYTLKVFTIVLAHAVFHGSLKVNPATDIAFVYNGGHRPDKLWDDDIEVAFYRTAPGYLSNALFLGCWTGQREGDLVQMRFNKGTCGEPYYNTSRRWVYLRQEKTQALVGFPAPKVLAEKLDAEWQRRQALGLSETRILLTSRGKPWANTHSFRCKFNKIKNGYGDQFRDLHFHDSRGTAATRLAVAAVPLDQIASITGHKESNIGMLVERYLGGRVQLAAKAIATAQQDVEYVERMLRIGAAFDFAA